MEDKIICPDCQSNNTKSRVYEGAILKTLMYCKPFYDEDGNRHHHDTNKSTINFTCSNKHSFTKQRLNSCWCGWQQSQ